MSERQPSDPLIDNPSGRVADGRVPYPSEIPCVTLFRQLLLERSNMLGKTPYDLIHSVGRMNRSSFIEFMTRTLHHRPTDAYLDQVEQHYGTSSNDGRQSGTVMIDLRRLLFDSMYLNDARPADGHKSSLFTALTAKSAIPSCWRGRRYSPAEIEEMLRSRVSERLAHKSPMSSLMRLLRRDSVDQAGGAHEPGGVSGEGHSTDAGGGLWGSGALSRGTVKRIFDIFDVVVLPEDFEAFFAAHDRGDGHVDFRYFLTRLLPPVDEENNPFRPKDEVELQHDVDLAKYLTFLTGKFRTASSFTRYTSGPNARPQSASAALRRTGGGDDHISGTAGTGGWVKGSLVRESTVAEKMEEANVTKERVIVHNEGPPSHQPSTNTPFARNADQRARQSDESLVSQDACPPRRPASAPPGSRRAVHDTDLSAESDTGADREASVKQRRRLIRRDKYALIGDIVRALVASNILEYPSKIAHDKDKIRQRGESKILYDAIEKSLKSNESELIDELDRGTEPESRVSANRLPVHPTPSPPASFQSRSATTLSPRHVSSRRVVSQSHLLKTGSQRKNENATSAVSVKCWDSEKGYTLQHSDPSSTGKFGSAGGFKESEEADGSDRVRGVAYDGGRSPGSGNDRSMNGRSRKGKINMYSTLLMQKYAISARHVTTAHQAYGLFSKTLETQRRKRAKMRKT
eukprot:gene3438-4268_t